VLIIDYLLTTQSSATLGLVIFVPGIRITDVTDTPSETEKGRGNEKRGRFDWKYVYKYILINIYINECL
jgi:hypothetical protein